MKKKQKASKKRKVQKKLIDKIGEELNEKQKLFAILYTTDRECFGNASKAYRTAYNLTPKQYKAGKVSAHHSLTNPNLKAFIKEYLKEGFVDEAVDQEIAKVIKQDKDLIAKNTAIKEYNKLKQRITENPLTIILPKPLLDLPYVQRNDSNQENITPEEED